MTSASDEKWRPFNCFFSQVGVRTYQHPCKNTKHKDCRTMANHTYNATPNPRHSFIHSIGMCSMRRFLATLGSFFHSSVLYTFPCHPSPPSVLPSAFTLSCHLFLGLPLNLVVSKFIYNTLLGIPFSSILCTCIDQHNLFSLIVSVIVGFFNNCI